MIIQEFSFGNFKSFKDLQTLNLAAAKIVSKNKKLDKTNVFKISDDENLFLKSKAIYGANASGKSNISKALVSFIRIVKLSIKDEKILRLIDSFKLSTETENEPTFFQLIFWHNNIKYRYGFELNENDILAEWLYSTPKQRELPLFIREGLKIIEVDKTNFSEGSKLVELLTEGDGDNDIFRNNSLFLSTVGSFGFGKLSKSIIDAISSIIVISGLGHPGMYDFASDSIKDEKMKKYIVDFLKYGDVGIEDLDSIEISKNEKNESKENNEIESNNTLVIAKRKKYNSNYELVDNEIFPFENESEGTQKLFELSPFIYKSINSNRPLIIDEFDARFHPLLTKKIVELFNSDNNKNSQLIFITHDTNLLSPELLRRDQIDFVEKDKYGGSHLFSLAEFKGIRNTASFEKDYINGKYGAIPFLGDFNKIINSDKDA